MPINLPESKTKKGPPPGGRPSDIMELNKARGYSRALQALT